MLWSTPELVNGNLRTMTFIDDPNAAGGTNGTCVTAALYAYTPRRLRRSELAQT